MYSSNGTDKMKDEDQVDKILFKTIFLEPSTPNQFFFRASYLSDQKS